MGIESFLLFLRATIFLVLYLPLHNMQPKIALASYKFAPKEYHLSAMFPLVEEL